MIPVVANQSQFKAEHKADGKIEMPENTETLCSLWHLRHPSKQNSSACQQMLKTFFVFAAHFLGGNGFAGIA